MKRILRVLIAALVLTAGGYQFHHWYHHSVLLEDVNAELDHTLAVATCQAAWAKWHYVLAQRDRVLAEKREKEVPKFMREHASDQPVCDSQSGDVDRGETENRAARASFLADPHLAGTLHGRKAKKACEEFYELTADQCLSVADGKAWIGMTDREAELSWGRPEEINRSAHASGIDEQWVYGARSFLFFESGVLVAIDTSRGSLE